MELLPLAEMNRRIDTDRSDSDATLFGSLLLKGELLTKLTVAAFVSLIPDESDRVRYGHLYQLVRASGIGDWADVIDKVLTGPSSQLLPQQARNAQRQLTENLPAGSWQNEAVRLLNDSLASVSDHHEQLRDRRIQAKRWFRDFATLRNTSRGHGAQRTATLSEACPSLEESLSLMQQNLELLSCPWAYIQQNLSGKYRVTYWAVKSELFEKLKQRMDERRQNGVYLDLDGLHAIDLVESDVDASDIWVANGKFNNNSYELLSYSTGNTYRSPSARYLDPPEHLPQSETQGLGQLSIVGKTFTNVPAVPSGYVSRSDLEAKLMEQLWECYHHPIVTLTGYGGIGKTSLALKVINEMMDTQDCLYDLVIWFSARDVDLLTTGPKPVRPQGITVQEFADEYQHLMGASVPGKEVVGYLSEQMNNADGDDFTKLFVFDNFETASDPVDLFRWVDTYIRPPNKVLITSRERRFTGDYAVDVHGMTDAECRELIDSAAGILHLRGTLTDDLISDVVRESRGHPYVIKIFLGALARDPNRKSLERIMAPQDEVLDALFERSYNRLSAPAQRAFLTLCTWRSSAPRIALEAVLLRPENELMQVDSAIDELSQMSFVEELGSEGFEEDVELAVPLSARLFGTKKLQTSPWRASAQTDSGLLQLFGAAQQHNDSQGGERRVRELYRNTAQSISRGRRTLDDIKPILEYVSRRFSVGWVLMADLIDEFGGRDDREQVLEYLMKYVEEPGSELYPAQEIWGRISRIHSESHDLYAALHALTQVSRQPGISVDELSNAANEINKMFRENDTSDLDPALKATIVKDVADVMEQRVDNLNGDGCSRLAWLYLNIRDGHEARRVANLGLQRDPDNHHCQRLIERLDRQIRW